jgi:hypothetical protein
MNFITMIIIFSKISWSAASSAFGGRSNKITSQLQPVMLTSIEGMVAKLGEGM